MNSEYDVLVAGSGVAGLTAALAAARAGARVAVVEAADRWGGTSGISAGAVWVPGNHLLGEPDDGARSYCLRHAHGRDPGLVDAFLAAAPAMARFVEEHTPLRLSTMDYPDTFAETEGGRVSGRHLEAAPTKVGDLGPWHELVWPMPYPPVLTNNEVFGGGIHGGGPLPYPLLQARMEADEVTMGLALVVGLMHGCRALGVTFVKNARVVSLVTSEDGAVTGAVVGSDVIAAKAVILANGGYESDPGLAGRLLGTPVPQPIAPPVNIGDALRLAASAGAELAHLGESWCWPAVLVPGESPDRPDVRDGSDTTTRAQMIVAERSMPHVLWVDASGHRFVNEAAHNCALALAETDPNTHQPRHSPAWAIGDDQFRQRYSVAGIPPGKPAPEWLVTAETLAELAGLIGVDPATLTATVERFNGFVHSGRDEDFGRGDTVYDRYTGDPTAPHPTLGTVERGPFFALAVHRGTIATKGGVRTDGSARALRWDGTAVPGLFAAGTAAAALFGPGAIANGMHLSFAMTWGWLAGTTATA